MNPNDVTARHKIALHDCGTFVSAEITVSPVS